MPHYSAQDEFEPTPNSLLARAASGSGPTQGAYVDRRRSQRRADTGAAGAGAGSGSAGGAGAGGVGVNRTGSRRERQSRLSGYDQYGHDISSTSNQGQSHSHNQVQAQGYGDLHYGHTPHQTYANTQSTDPLASSQGQWGAFAHGGSMGYADAGIGADTSGPGSGFRAPVKPLYYDQDDEPDQAFDVRADFDGTGPRWSERYGTGKGDPRNYNPLPDNASQYDKPRATPTPMLSHSKSAYEREELVSVPVLGPEWKKSELHEMSKRGRSEVAGEKRQAKIKSFMRDQRGLCGVKWMTRRNLVIFLFVLCIGTALALFFTIPRPPAYSFYQAEPMVVDNSTVQFSRVPANFSFTGNLNVFADTSSSYLPLQFSDIIISLYHLNTNKLIGTGNFGHHTVSKGQQVPIQLPVNVSYSAINTTDTTWSDWYNACGHIWAGTQRPSLSVRMVVQSKIVGLVTTPEAGAVVGDVACPFELPSNSV